MHKKCAAGEAQRHADRRRIISLDVLKTGEEGQDSQWRDQSIQQIDQMSPARDQPLADISVTIVSESNGLCSATARKVPKPANCMP